MICISFRFVGLKVMVMVFNATFNNISVISWQSVLFVEETGVPGWNHWHVATGLCEVRVVQSFCVVFYQPWFVFLSWLFWPLHWLYLIKLCVIKFLSDLRYVGGFLRVLRFPPPIKLITTIIITEILLKVALNTITPFMIFIRLLITSLWYLQSFITFT